MRAERTALVVDRNRLFREGLKQLLQTAGIAVAGDGISFAEALQRIDAGTPPDLAICNLEVIQNTIPGSQDFKRRFPQARLMVLSEDFTPAGALYAAESGADAYLPTDMQAEALEHCLNLVLMGQQLYPAHTVQGREPAQPAPLFPGLVQEQAALQADLALEAALPVQLSTRERQILSYLVSGWSNKLIARELDIAEATVKVHVKGLMRKVQAVNRTQIAIWALGHGMGALQEAS